MKKALFLIFFITYSLSGNDDRLIIYGEYPVVEEIKSKPDKDIKNNVSPLIDYKSGNNYKERALIEAFHFLNANIYGYTFTYKPKSTLMKVEEVFDIRLKGEMSPNSIFTIGDGVYDNVYRVRIGFDITPSVKRWLYAFGSNRLRLATSEGTSDFFSGWEKRSSAYKEALRNLVLISARKKISSKPISIKGDILLKGQPIFSVDEINNRNRKIYRRS